MGLLRPLLVISLAQVQGPMHPLSQLPCPGTLNAQFYPLPAPAATLSALLGVGSSASGLGVGVDSCNSGPQTAH